jgi:hypothetical protein
MTFIEYVCVINIVLLMNLVGPYMQLCICALTVLDMDVRY